MEDTTDWKDTTDWVGKLEDARKDIEEAETDREAIVIAFTELYRLVLAVKYVEEGESDGHRT
ncbi:MAG: hypothetical protein WDZ83_14380 [Rhizobiaceae bacterium]